MLVIDRINYLNIGLMIGACLAVFEQQVWRNCRPQKERGQAHLPNPELIPVRLICWLKAFRSGKYHSNWQSLGWEGWLAPALPFLVECELPVSLW